MPKINADDIAIACIVLFLGALAIAGLGIF